MKYLKSLVGIVVFTCLIQSVFSQNNAIMQPAKSSKAAYSGILWSSLNRTPLINAHVFAVSEAGEILAHCMTKRNPDSGWFQLLNLPVNKKIQIIGFHESMKTNIVIKNLKTKPGYHDLGNELVTSTEKYVSGKFGYMENVNSINKNKSSARLADILLHKLKCMNN